MATNIDLVANVAERLKTSPIGDLVTEDDLRDIVKAAIQKTFFEPRIVKDSSGWSSRDVVHPPLIQEVMASMLKDAAAEHIKAWLNEHPDIVAEYWRKVMDEGVMKYVQAMTDAQATNHLRIVLNGWINAINADRMNRGLDIIPIYGA